MKDISFEIDMLICCGSEKLFLRSESANDVLPVMASTIALTNSREDLNEVKSRATTFRDILYCLRSTITLGRHAHSSSLRVCVRLIWSRTSFPFPKGAIFGTRWDSSSA